MAPDPCLEKITRMKERAHLPVSSKARNVRANLILSMAIYHLTVKTGSRYGGQSALAKSEYIEREGKYARQDDERAHRESDNMPEWAEEDPRSYWEAADAHERANGGFPARWNLLAQGVERGRAD